MADFKLLNYAGVAGEARPGLLIGDDRVLDIQQVAGDQPWAASTMDMFAAWDTACPALHDLAEAGGETRPLADVQLLAPLLYPACIYCAGANYKKHAMEMSPDGKTYPDKTVTDPYFFIKAGPHCVIGPGAEIRLPKVSKQVDWEAEFAVIIGKEGRNIPLDKAFEHVAGYTILNDLSARDRGKREDWPRFGVDWFGHKVFEGSAPMGPWVTPADQIADPYACRMQLWVNDEKMQDEFVSDLIFDIAEQIEWLSRGIKLRPGDVVSTGTPSGVGRPRGIFLKPGDTVTIEVDGVGTLVNPVMEGE